jgi:hypothetical protein
MIPKRFLIVLDELLHLCPLKSSHYNGVSFLMVAALIESVATVILEIFGADVVITHLNIGALDLQFRFGHYFSPFNLLQISSTFA